MTLAARKSPKVSVSDHIFDSAVTLFSVLALVVSIYPLYFVLIASFSNPDLVSRGEVTLFPKEFTLEAYQYIFKNNQIWRGYANTLLYVTGSVIFGLIITIPGAYAISRDDMVGHGLFTKLITFTMFFHGGLIPTYIMMKNFHLVNTPWVVILLPCTTVFNVIVARTFFKNNLPRELTEAAEVDGCGNLRFFFSIALPLSSVVVAIIALYIAVAQWNSFFNAMIYLNEDKYQPLQMVLRKILITGQTLGNTGEMTSEEIEASRRISLLVKYSLIVVSSLPIIMLYPFLQRYFVKGVMIGSIKG